MNTKSRRRDPRCLPNFLSAAAILSLAFIPALPMDADYLCDDGIETARAGLRSSRPHDHIASGPEPTSESFCNCCMEVYEINNGVPLTGINAPEGELLRFHLDVPAEAGYLEFSLSGGTGDADLYVNHDTEPTLELGDCGSAGGSNHETCWFASPDPGAWHVAIQAHGAFAGATLVASYNTWAQMDFLATGDFWQWRQASSHE